MNEGAGGMVPGCEAERALWGSGAIDYLPDHDVARAKRREFGPAGASSTTPSPEVCSRRCTASTTHPSTRPRLGVVTSIVIVGSGFTGFNAPAVSPEFSGGGARRGHHIISPVDYMLYTPLLPDVAGGLLDARFVTSAGRYPRRCPRHSGPGRGCRLRTTHPDL